MNHRLAAAPHPATSAPNFPSSKVSKASTADECISRPRTSHDSDDSLPNDPPPPAEDSLSRALIPPTSECPDAEMRQKPPKSTSCPQPQPCLISPSATLISLVTSPADTELDLSVSGGGRITLTRIPADVSYTADHDQSPASLHNMRPQLSPSATAELASPHGLSANRPCLHQQPFASPPPTFHLTTAQSQIREQRLQELLTLIPPPHSTCH